MRSWMIGLPAGILAGAFLPALPPAGVTVAASVLGCLLSLCPYRPLRLCGPVLLGLCLAAANGQLLLAARLPESCVSKALVVSGTVDSLPRRTLMRDGTPRQRFEFVPLALQPVQCAGPRRILLSYYGKQTLQPGQRWQLEVKLKRPWGLANPGSFNMQAWFAQSGIDAVGSVRAESAKLLPAPLTLSALHHRLRARISARIDEIGLPVKSAAVLKALTVADRSGLDSRLWSLLQQFGVNHLLVISGLHIGLLAGLGYLAGSGLARAGQWLGLTMLQLPGLLALTVALLYAALAGFSVSTLRALCMLASFIAAGFCSRYSTGSNNLLLAALGVLLLNPLAGLGSGFWLSFTAVAALLWSGRWQGSGGRLRRAWGTHLYMSMLMLPLGAWWFGGASAVSAPANLLLVPLVGFYVVPLALLATACFMLGLPLDSLLWRCASLPLDMLLPVARQLSVAYPLYHPLAAGTLASALALVAIPLVVLPLSWRSRLLVALLLLPLLLPRQSVPGDLRLAVLDVGQGTAAVVHAGTRALLYDTGGGDPAGANLALSVVLPYLRQQGVRTLDTFVISHPDSDHSAGAAAVLDTMPVQRLRYGRPLQQVPGGRRCRAGEAWAWPEGVRFQFLSPAREWGRSSNDSSCVLQVHVGGYRLLLAGDIEESRERELARYWGGQLQSQWLLLPHHGSRTSSTHLWLKHVDPDIAVITSGYGNRFGHPHTEVVQRLQGQGVRTLYSHRTGAMEFVLQSGKPLSVSTWRDRIKPYWM